MNPVYLLVGFMFLIIILLFWYIYDSGKVSINALIHENISLKDQVAQLQEERRGHFKKEQEEKWRPGIQCIHHEELIYGKKGEANYVEFVATYTCEILAVAENEVQVKVIDVFTDKTNIITNYGKTGIIEFLNDKWIKKSGASIIKDDAYYRLNTIKDIIENG